SAAEWKVDARTPVTPSRSSRVRISVAALSVNVTASIWDGRKDPVATWWAMRCVMGVALPEPAGERMQMGPREPVPECDHDTARRYDRDDERRIVETDALRHLLRLRIDADHFAASLAQH